MAKPVCLKMATIMPGKKRFSMNENLMCPFLVTMVYPHQMIATAQVFLNDSQRRVTIQIDEPWCSDRKRVIWQPAKKAWPKLVSSRWTVGIGRPSRLSKSNLLRCPKVIYSIVFYSFLTSTGCYSNHSLENSYHIQKST